MTKKGFYNLSITEWLYIIAVVGLSTAGLLVFYSLSIESSLVDLFKQLGMVVLGWLLFFWSSRTDYRFLKSVGNILYGLLLILLFLVIILGEVKYGARRWIDLGLFSFQPSEIGKILFAVFLAKFMSSRGEQFGWRDLLISIWWLALPFLLVVWQPDLGTALVFVVIWGVMIYVSPLSRRYIGVMITLVLLALPLIWFGMHDYQRNRILTFIEPSRDPYGAGYNVLQSQIAVGSGGWWGQGLGRGWQSQLHFLPVAYSDFAFAVLAEEFGFVGSVVVLICFAYVVWYVWRVGFQATDQFGFYLAVGLGAMFLFQFIVNIAMNIGIMPVTGIPLPLISSGGTSILTYFYLLGLVYSIGGRQLQVG